MPQESWFYRYVLPLSTSFYKVIDMELQKYKHEGVPVDLYPLPFLGYLISCKSQSEIQTYIYMSISRHAL